MNNNFSDITVLNFAAQFGHHLSMQGEQHLGQLEKLVEQAVPGSIVAFCLQGVEYLGYSYAKSTIRKMHLRALNGKCDKRRFVLVTQRDEMVLDGLDAALKEKKLAMYAAPSPEAIGREGFLLGRTTHALTETFDVLLQQSPVTTGELAGKLNMSPQNTKNRIDRLVGLGLATREKVASESGGYEWLNRVM